MSCCVEIISPRLRTTIIEQRGGGLGGAGVAGQVAVFIAPGAVGGIPAGTNGQVLTTVSGAAAWANDAGMSNPMTTAGDLITGGVAGAPGRLGIGTGGQVLTVVSGAPAWAAATGGGSTSFVSQAKWGVD